jgi:hypothetical protein
MNKILLLTYMWGVTEFARAYPRVIGGRLMDQQLSLLNTEFNSHMGLFKTMLILIRSCNIIVTERNRYADMCYAPVA